MPLRQVERTSVAAAVFAQVADGILSGEFPPDSTLPSERELTTLLGVNRQAVREALQRLEQMGLVEIRHGGPTRVTDFRRRAGLDLLGHLLIRPDGSVDLTVARSVMEMRAVVGPDVARLCALRATPDIATSLTACIDEMVAATTLTDLVAVHLRFWDLLAEGSGNVAYQLCINGLRHLYGPVADLVHEVLADELRQVEAHRAVVDAVTAADPPAAAEAARALLRHGEEAIERVLEMLDEIEGLEGEKR